MYLDHGTIYLDHGAIYLDHVFRPWYIHVYTTHSPSLPLPVSLPSLPSSGC